MILRSAPLLPTQRSPECLVGLVQAPAWSCHSVELPNSNHVGSYHQQEDGHKTGG